MTPQQVMDVFDLISQWQQEDTKKNGKNAILLERVREMIAARQVMLEKKGVNSTFSFHERQRIRRANWICSVSSVGEDIDEPNLNEFSW